MLTRNLPIFLVFGAALVIGLGVMVFAGASDDDDTPAPTMTPSTALTQFQAEQAAKRAYFDSDPSVSAAACLAQGYDTATEIWRVQCTIQREGATVRSVWAVQPDGSATRVTDTPPSPS
jgi:hypothetical protein